MENEGWLRAATFGGMDGLTTSIAFVIGFVAAGADLKFVLSGGVLAAIAGAMSMGIGEYVSVSTHNEQPNAHYFGPWIAALSSFASFAVGSAIPLLPLLFGSPSTWVFILIGGVALFGAGVLATKFTVRSWWFGGFRQLILGAIATAVTYGVGLLFTT